MPRNLLLVAIWGALVVAGRADMILAADAALSARAAERIAAPRILVIAHRGDSKVAPENTLPAFVSAVKAGSDLVELKVNSITVQGRVYPVVTSPVETKSSGEGKKTARKAVGGAGLGAIIGGIAGGGSGAAIGALAGGAGGTILAATGQPHLKIPPETRLQFQLAADWKIQ